MMFLICKGEHSDFLSPQHSSARQQGDLQSMPAFDLLLCVYVCVYESLHYIIDEGLLHG